MEEVEVWIARDKNNGLNAFSDKPIKCNGEWDNNLHDKLGLPFTCFPSIKWEDKEPTKAKITLMSIFNIK